MDTLGEAQQIRILLEVAGDAAGGALEGAPVLVAPPHVVGDEIGDLRVEILQHLQHSIWKEDRVRPAKQQPLVPTSVQSLLIQNLLIMHSGKTYWSSAG